MYYVSVCKMLSASLGLGKDYCDTRKSVLKILSIDITNSYFAAVDSGFQEAIRVLNNSCRSSLRMVISIARCTTHLRTLIVLSIGFT